MAIKKTQKGFALLVAVIFMSVMLTFGLGLGSLAYKQEMLASGASQSQYAFYAADSALECVLYADQQQNLFAFPATDPGSAPAMTCDGTAAISATEIYTPGSKWVVTERLSFPSQCADVNVYKPAPGTGSTYLFAQGYSVPCATLGTSARFVSRGLKASY
jgi:hypothetical protein